MSEQIIDIASIVAIAGLIVSVITLYLNQRKTKKELELAKEYVHTLSRLVESYRTGMRTNQQLQKEKFEWEKLKTIGKAFGWMIEHSEEDDDYE